MLPDHRLLMVVLAALVLQAPTVVADPVSFSDNFSADTLRMSIDERANDDVVRSYDVQNDRIVMTASATGDEQGFARVHAWGRSDTLTARIRLSSATMLTGNENANAKLRIKGVFYNEFQDRGTADQEGDVEAEVAIRLGSDGGLSAGFCIDRSADDPVTVIDGGNCANFAGVVPSLDSEYTVSIAVDRGAGTMDFSWDEITRRIELGQPVYLPARENREIKLSHDAVGGAGSVTESVHMIGTDDYQQDFLLEAPAVGPYRHNSNLNGTERTLQVVDSQARFDVASTDSQGRVNLTVEGESDSIEAIIELSNSVIADEAASSEDSYAQSRLGGTFYNDTAEGGFNGVEGNVFSGITLRANADGSRRLDYCAFRSNTDDFSDSIELIAGGDGNCSDFGFIPELDIPYPVSIKLDRAARTLAYTVNSIARVYTIGTDTFLPESQFISLRARSAGGLRP